MAETKWERFNKAFHRNFMDFLGIFAAEDRFIHEHKHRSSRIAEQDRYGSVDDEKENDN